MSGLLYRQDMDEVRERLTTWWHGGDIGRPCMQVTAPRAEPLEDVPAVPEPPVDAGAFSPERLEYHVNRAARACARTHYLGEGVPAASTFIGPGMLALFLGCRAREESGTLWREPCIERPEDARLEYDSDNPYWNYLLRLTRELKRAGEGKFLVAFGSLHEGLDVLASLRGTERFLLDLVDRPEWVRGCLRRITDLFFRHYDVLYDLVQDETGGSVYLAWAPGRMHRLQCDVSAMISPEVFGDLMVPVMREMCERISYTGYHWDGPGAIPHHEHLLSIEQLGMIQWVPGAGVEPSAHPRWWPLYHKTIEAGKRVMVYPEDAGELKALKREFGPRLNSAMIVMRAASLAEARKIMAIVQ